MQITTRTANAIRAAISGMELRAGTLDALRAESRLDGIVRDAGLWPEPTSTGLIAQGREMLRLHACSQLTRRAA